MTVKTRSSVRGMEMGERVVSIVFWLVALAALFQAMPAAVHLRQKYLGSLPEGDRHVS
jgi:hypothetical protein